MSSLSDTVLQCDTLQDNSGAGLPLNLRNKTLFAGATWDGNPVTLHYSHNVSSITDRGVGAFTVNLTNAVADINSMCVTACAVNEGVAGLWVTAGFLRTTTAVGADCYTGAGALQDPTYTAVQIFDLGI